MPLRTKARSMGWGSTDTRLINHDIVNPIRAPRRKGTSRQPACLPAYQKTGRQGPEEYFRKGHSRKISRYLIWCAWAESNCHIWLRRPPRYPLRYRRFAFNISLLRVDFTYLLIFDLMRVYTGGTILKGVSEDEIFNKFSRSIDGRYFCNHRMRHGCDSG